jgi:hypothetical protein
MLSWFTRNSTGARLWISDQRPDDYRRELTRIYEALSNLFEMERNLVLVPLLLSVVSAIIALIAFPPSFAPDGWQRSVAVGGGVLLGVFLLSSVVIRFWSRSAHQKVLEELQLQASQKRVQVIIKHLSDQDRAIRPIVRRYHLAEEKHEHMVRPGSVRPVPPTPGKRESRPRH